MAPEARDAADPLRRWRDQFELPPGTIYLAGHSLGALPKRTVGAVAQAVQIEWGHDLVAGWNSRDWIGAPERVGAKLAPLIGAAPDEVLVADSTSVNLFKLAAALLLHRPERRAILIESGEFPTDMHIAQGLAATLGRGRRVKFARKGAIEAKIDEKIALLIVTHVHYREGRVRDMVELTRRAQETGAFVIWDLSHSVGAVPVDLHAAGADFAVGCGYKYLNGGPGAPAFLYVSKRWQEKLGNPISGWLGHADPFAFVDPYVPAPGISRFQSGTPPILSFAALESALDLMNEAPRGEMEVKRQALTQLFIERVFAKKRPGLSLLSPENPAMRGGHVALKHKESAAIVAAMKARGIIGDHRTPDCMRFAFPPLYISYAEAAAAADALVDVLRSQAHRDPAFASRAKVT